MGKGERYERKFVNEHRERGMGAQRIGGSGSGTADDRADVLFRIDDHYYVGEAKFSGTGDRIYVKEHEVTGLLAEATLWNARAVLLPRWSTQAAGVSIADWFVVDPSEAPRTDSNHVTLGYDECVERWPTLSEVLD